MGEYDQLAEAIIEKIGGKDNVSYASHCITRLRLNLKNPSLANKDGIQEIDGVIGTLDSGGQLQIIIGQHVPKVYRDFVAKTEIETRAAIPENLDDQPKEKLTPKVIGNNILGYLSGSLIQIIPILTAAGMFKATLTVIAPGMLNLVSDESDLYILMDFIYNAGFYFFPIYVGYAAANKIGVTPVLGMFMGGILIAPKLIEIADAGTPFTVYGIPMMVNNYSSTVVPILLSVWIMSYVEGFFKKVMPDAFSTIFTPFFTIAIMVPVSLCALAPLGAFIGSSVISPALLGLGSVAGFLAVAVIGALWQYIVLTGMHHVLIVAAISIMMEQGSEGVVMVGANCASIATFGIAFGAFLVLKNKQEKALSLGYFVSGIIGGITEPAMYGLGIRYGKPFIALSIGGFLGGLYAGLTGVQYYVFGATNFLSILGFVGGGSTNLINGIIASVIAFGSAAAATVIIMRPKTQQIIETAKVQTL
ncbi:MAG: PTS transporter subunit EIIC [Bifidobacteriaceae bacterium]|jgi:PTS system beta-glucosides-specific IIC component|nr:PTS transporter subunit EIIC [Bifidobacteriaceae bacterium]